MGVHTVWMPHWLLMNTTNTTSSCLSSLSQINRAKHLLDTTSLLNLINPLIFGKLYYCFSVWSSMSKENISKLQNTQHYTAWIGTCSTCKDDHITPGALRELELLIMFSPFLFIGTANWCPSAKEEWHRTILLIDSRGLILPAGTLKIRIRLIFQVTELLQVTRPSILKQSNCRILYLKGLPS